MGEHKRIHTFPKGIILKEQEEFELADFVAVLQHVRRYATRIPLLHLNTHKHYHKK